MNVQNPAFSVDVSRGEVEARLHRFTHEAMACTWEAYLVAGDTGYAHQAAHAAFEEVDRIEGELSRFIEHSDIARINVLGAGQSLRVGIETFECLELAARVHADTEGAFDVTFASERGETESGTADRGHALPLDLNRADRRFTMLADGVRIDLGGIGKGYALDQLVALLKDWDVESALIHCGQSTVLALGTPPEQAGWQVSLRDPVDQTTTLKTVRLRDQALAGSGMLLHGPHIVDPRTCEQTHGVVGAWALAPSAALADALSTAFMVLGRKEVEVYCRKHPDVGGILRLEDTDNQVMTFGDETLRGDSTD